MIARATGPHSSSAIVAISCACFAVLIVLSIGPFLFVTVVVALVVLMRRSGGVGEGVNGFVSGVGVLLLTIAYLNRHGPGDYCETSATEQRCTSEWSPWPWLIVGVLLVAGGVLFFCWALRAPVG